MNRGSELRRGFNAVSRALTAVLLTAALAGCGKGTGPTLVPVVGKVTIDGKPATNGGVSFRDVATGMIQPGASILADGTYSLVHHRRPGAPAGQYRVVVFVNEPLKPGVDRLPRVIVNKKYTNPNTTPLMVEVDEGAPVGRYDLAVTR